MGTSNAEQATILWLRCTKKAHEESKATLTDAEGEEVPFVFVE